ncbi:dihydroorotate dehydrogenase electron transfer subunit [Desulfuromonas acetoxidans]|uniref:dihydroorotate dehydrogenase electron transfer subunit n=1 Tax=Desulfuromonas acetoxidans TaxID=891 RepID=UPI0029310A57|nr:dihydroorotate dehydrogenase electron transfer subunit [Desulfuromonas acetoxidans]
MQNLKTVILHNREIAPGYYRMAILAPGYPQTAKAGQFVMLRVQLQAQPLLRRPFGIFKTGTLPPECSGMPPREFVELVYKVVGSGTELMATLQRGDQVELLGPLGEGFVATEDENPILVGGGIGLVPLFKLAEDLCRQGRKVRLLMGGRTRDDILGITEFERLGVETYVSTDDGSLGEEGLVTAVLERKLAKYPGAQVYACGPTPMLNAVQAICATHSTPLQVSLEALMACGVGACLGCVVPGKEHREDEPDYLCTCRQGPVFDAELLQWPESGGAA